MTRKNNPWVSLVAMVLLAVILVWTCTGCQEVEAATNEAPPRYTVENETHDGIAFYTVTDTLTGAQYLYCRSGYGGGMAALQPVED